MNITDEGGHNVRNHGNYGHGLRPGTTADLNCPNCKREDAQATASPIVEITGSDLAILLRQLSRKPDDISKISVSTDLGQVKVKVNEGIWSPPLGRQRA